MFLRLQALIYAGLVLPAAAETLIVENGQPRAEIVISATPQRTVRLAAHDLQTYVQKISGARLPIVTEPSNAATAKLYLGRSPHTDCLNISASGLRDGAYRLVSGANWLAFIGDDTDFTPIEPWARNNGEIVSGKVQREWDKVTGALWGIPHLTLYKNRLRLPADIGLPDGQSVAKNAPPLELWSFDERGSFNAVCGFLAKLGVRWYMPGEIGEVVPSLKTIPLPVIDETTRPDFPVRQVNIRFAVNGYDTAMWAMRLGLRDSFGTQIAHGMDDMTHRDEIFTAHPEWFALYGGKRQVQPNQRLNQLCYSNEDLFRETVRNARAQFDHYKLDTVSVMPPDGYTAICQCPLCAGKDTPEAGERGRLSDYVWDFVNRVAREVAKTHPNQKVLNCAYGVYTLPPQKIAKLEPNVQVCIVGGRRPAASRPEEQEELRRLREAWAAKTDNPILIFENYPFTDRGWYLPSFIPHTIGAGINATKGMSLGEDIWLSMRQDFDRVGIGFNHHLVYFTARMYWGGKQQDVDPLFREYCRLFYGPAEKPMLTFFGYCEANWQAMENDKTTADTALDLFAKAQASAPPESVYAKRIAFIDDFLKGLRNKSQQLAKKRGPVPVLRLVGEARDKIVIDGKLDDAAWTNCPVAATGQLRELQTGRVPTFGTTFKAAWIGNNLYFAIRCNERPGDKPNITATKRDDPALWYGDAVEVLLETESRSYYQIAVSPAGATADLDRSAAKNSWFGWDAQAEVATQVAEDHWIVEMRIPVIQDENDPLHQVIGHKPTKSLPWHINLCRQRIREGGQEYSAFSPTATDHFHEAMKFAHFYDGNSHRFEAAEPDPDFIHVTRTAAELAQRGKHAEAIAHLTALAETKITDFQKSAALAQAAASAAALKQFDAASAHIARIPIDSVKKTALMYLLLAQQKAPQIIADFGGEDLTAWPFWQRGAGHFARGRAYAIAKQGAKAESDLAQAADWTSDLRDRTATLLALGLNREHNIKDESAALAAYRQIVDPLTHIGGADQFTAAQGIARILTRGGQFAEDLAVLHKSRIDELRGSWRGSMLLAVAETQQAAGQTAEALATCRTLLADPSVEPRHRKSAEEKLQALGAKQP